MTKQVVAYLKLNIIRSQDIDGIELSTNKQEIKIPIWWIDEYKSLAIISEYIDHIHKLFNLPYWYEDYKPKAVIISESSLNRLNNMIEYKMKKGDIITMIRNIKLFNKC
jgi:hypothetical protein